MTDPQPITYTPQFQAPVWKDNVDLILAEGPSGFNIQFQNLRVELDALSSIVKTLSDTITSVNQALNDQITSVSQTLGDQITSVSQTANDAQTAAGSATTTANDAQTAAGSATATANSAKTTANSAKTTANSAKTAADSANTTANTANATANAAQTTAASAIAIANSAQTAADLANTTANTAQTTAKTANTTASTAMQLQPTTTLNFVSRTVDTSTISVSVDYKDPSGQSAPQWTSSQILPGRQGTHSLALPAGATEIHIVALAVGTGGGPGQTVVDKTLPYLTPPTNTQAILFGGTFPAITVNGI